MRKKVGRQSGQPGMQVIDMEMMIQQRHLLRKIDKMTRFDFIYELLAPYYPPNDRPSVDSVRMFKMLLVGYLFGIKSERRLVEEVRLNLAYCWFCGFELLYISCPGGQMRCFIFTFFEPFAVIFPTPANI